MVGRRGFVAAGALLLTGCGRASSGASSDAKVDLGTRVQGDIEVLNGLLALEHQAVAFYGDKEPYAAHEAEHVRRLQDAVREKQGTPVAAEPLGDGIDAAKLENTLIAAYVDAIPKLADPKLRALAASIVATEAEHLAAVSDHPAPQAFVFGERQL